MRVLKFGGTSVADAPAIRRVATVVTREHLAARNGAPVIVVSALGGVTNRLLRRRRSPVPVMAIRPAGWSMRSMRDTSSCWQRWRQAR